MKKYLVDVYLPAVGKHLDVSLPTGKPIGEATGLLAKIAEDLTHGGFKGSDSSLLLNADTGALLDRDATVYDAGIRHSSRLILI